MKIKPNRSPRALIALLPTLMLVSPAFAQEAPTQTPPPPAPLVQSAPAPSAAPVFAPPAPVVQAVPDYTTATPPPVADAPAANPTASPRATAGRTARAVPVARAVSVSPRDPASVVAAPAAVIAPATTNPIAETLPPVAPVTPAAPVATTTQQTTTQASFAIWPWIVGAGVVLIGLIGLFAIRRRPRAEEIVYEEAAYQAAIVARPDPILAPVVAAAMAREPHLLRPNQLPDPVAAPAPVPAEETRVVAAYGAVVAALTDGDAPIANRPWLEFSMRPVRAGTTSDEALVEIELTVGNAGSVAADDVRISTFLFAAAPANAADVEKLLLEHGDASANPVSIAAGEGTRVDATLALPKRDLAALFNPVIVADARYRLADGSEGRTYASFTIGMMQEDGALGALKNNRPSMHEDIEARLYGTPQHA